EVTPNELVTLVGKTGFSRYFVVGGDGYPRAYLHIKDVLYADTDDAFDAPVQSKRFRPLFTVTAADAAEEALAQIRKVGLREGRAQALGRLSPADALAHRRGDARGPVERGRSPSPRTSPPPVAPARYRSPSRRTGGTRPGTSASDAPGGPTTSSDSSCNGA